MNFTERQIESPRLFFVEKFGYVIIGVNRINKQIYQQHKATFDKIIEFGDSAWNKPIDYEELTNYVYRLEQAKLLYT